MYNTDTEKIKLIENEHLPSIDDKEMITCRGLKTLQVIEENWHILDLPVMETQWSRHRKTMIKMNIDNTKPWKTNFEKRVVHIIISFSLKRIIK